jgi:hypothetical protein
MSLGLPDFGSRGGARQHHPFWRVVQGLGFLALAYSLVLAAIEWRSARSADFALKRATTAAAEASRAFGETRGSLQKGADLLVAAASIESSPGRVLKDLSQLLPQGVSLTSLKVEYLPEFAARIDFTVVARTPSSYDRFLDALASSPSFSDIKPGSESRPGLVKATVSAMHRPGRDPDDGK